MSRTRCNCGRGYVSQHDGKCGNCRTKKEKEALNKLFEPIKEFKNEFSFLSNFHMCPVKYEGEMYPSSEHAYMAAKTVLPVERMNIASIRKPSDAKKYGRQIQLRPNWEQLKERAMLEILWDKFRRNPSLREALIATAHRELIEGNWWGDKIWGVCLKTNQGKNLLGKTLMKIRAKLMETPKMLYYAGIGSRETPDDVQKMMARIGEQLADVWTVRSGFADGADKAFAFGAEKGNGLMENYLPWQGFNGAPINDNRFVYVDDPDLMAAAGEIARKYHPNWAACSSAARNMHRRNVFQVLGHDLKTHSHMVVCWTPRGSGSGGTGQAIRIARGYGIPVFDLAIEEHKQKLVDFVALQERQNFEDSLPW